MPLAISIDYMVSEVKRELSLRSRVYQRWVTNGTLRPAAAADQIERLRAVLEALEELRLLRLLEVAVENEKSDLFTVAFHELQVFRLERAPLTTGTHAKVSP